MSWPWRSPRWPAQPGWQAPHELVDDYAARGVEIERLTGALASTENMLMLAQGRFAESERTVKDQAALILDLNGRIERQADNHEADRAEWERAKSRMAARISELEQTLVAGVAKAGLDAAWLDAAAVSGPQSKAYGRQ